jgi:RNA polymerase sigma-70 factor (ECF subfamily)
MEQQELIQKIKSGDEVAFEKLFRLFYQPLCSYAHSFISDMDVAEEIVQDILVKLWQKRETLNLEHAIRPYLYRSVQNRCLNHFRHESIKKEHQRYSIAVQDDAYEATSSRVTLKELQEKLNEGIAILPPACREVFRLSRNEGLSYKEIADVLQISAKTVENQIGKALKILRIHLSDFLIYIVYFYLAENFLSAWGIVQPGVF